MVALSVTTISAQEKIVYGGIGLPNGKFGGDESNELVLFGGKEGGAALGLNVGFKILQPISPELSWFVSADVFYNGLHSDIKDDIDDSFDEVEKTPSYINVPVMGGVNYSIAELGTGVTLWAEAGLGLNFRYVNGLNAYDKGVTTIGGDDYNFKDEYEYTFDSKFMVAFQLGAGVKINDQFTIGLNYYSLGSDKMSYTAKRELTIGGDSDSDKIDDKTDKKLSTSLIGVRVGFCF